MTTPARKRRPEHQAGQDYATKVRRGTSRAVAVSLDARAIARLDALCARHAKSRSALVRWLLERAAINSLDP